MKYTIAIVLLMLVACAGLTPKQQLGAIELGFDDAVRAAAIYDSLPSCTTAATVICSSTVIAKQIKAAKDVAQTAIDSAKSAIYNPAFDASTLSSVLATAKAAVAALTAITTLESVQAAIKGAQKP